MPRLHSRSFEVVALPRLKETSMYYGSCLCKKVTFKIIGDFKGFFLCHCNRCQKQTGSAHAANLFSQTAKLEWLTGQDHINIFHLPNTRFMKSFCSTCGAALPSIQESGRLLVPAGCLDSEVPIQPDAHIFMGSRAKWDNNLERIKMFEKLPS